MYQEIAFIYETKYMISSQPELCFLHLISHLYLTLYDCLKSNKSCKDKSI